MIFSSAVSNLGGGGCVFKKEINNLIAFIFLELPQVVITCRSPAPRHAGQLPAHTQLNQGLRFRAGGDENTYSSHIKAHAWDYYSR